MQVIRAIVIFIGLIFLLLGTLFISGISTVPIFWLNAYLVGATLVTYAIATLWIGITQTYKALVGGGLSLIVTFGGIGLYLLRLSLKTSSFFQMGEFCLYIAILSVWLLFLGLKVSKRKTERLPLSTQWLFALVLTLILLEGLYLVIPLPGHFLWVLPEEFSVFYGWILIGSSLFFGWNLIQPIWENGYPLLYALLTYDVLLIGPYLSLLKGPVQVAIVPFYLWIALITIIGSGMWALLELIGRFFAIRKVR